jgi:hypothetical protein
MIGENGEGDMTMKYRGYIYQSAIAAAVIRRAIALLFIVVVAFVLVVVGIGYLFACLANSKTRRQSKQG